VTLTKAQQAVLDELRRPGVRALWILTGLGGNVDAYWFLTSDHRRCTKQIRILAARGLVTITRKGLHSATAIAVQP
jgi:hypothetical protein